ARAVAAAHQPTAGLRGGQEGDRALLGEGRLVVGIAGEREGGILEREDVAAVADVVAVDHFFGHLHRQDGVARLDGNELDAETAAGNVVGPHGVGAGARDRERVHYPLLLPVNDGGRFSRNGATPYAKY